MSTQDSHIKLLNAPLSHESIMKSGRYDQLSLTGADPTLVARLHRFMVYLRRVEEAILEEYHPADEIRCPVHFCIGQEAVPAALSTLLTPEDYMFSHHRSHGFYLAKSGPLTKLMAELYGRTTGANGGMVGSQDLSLPENNFHSGAILAGSVAIAIGSAMGIQMKGGSSISVAGFGEGASDEGVFWESLNYAALRRLPVVFLCENNGYATYSGGAKRQAPGSLSERVAAFGVESRSIFGNDAVAVHRAVEEAVSKARNNEGPSFIEAFTYRWNGHVGPEDDDYLGYRPQAEIDSWKANCPIVLLEEKMTEEGRLTAGSKGLIEAEIKAEIADAFEFAKASPWPTEANWAGFNYSSTSPVADKLLQDVGISEFDENQPITIPGPY